MHSCILARMTAAPFDTLAAARELTAAGMDRGQAEAVASAIRAGQGELVTRDTLRAELAALEARLTWRIFLVAGAQAGLIVALIKLLP